MGAISVADARKGGRSNDAVRTMSFSDHPHFLSDEIQLALLPPADWNALAKCSFLVPFGVPFRDEFAGSGVFINSLFLWSWHGLNVSFLP